MKKISFLLIALSALLFAGVETETCVKCHPAIVEEFGDSMHKKSSVNEDKIHKAVWDKHPARESGDYKCANCHTPNVKKETVAKTDEVEQGFSCSSCHTIKDVELHAQENKNIHTTEDKTFFSAEAGRESEKVKYKYETSMLGLNKTSVGSPYHTIDYTNEKFYTGAVCMGCHSHKQNAEKFTICETDEKGAKDKKQNCITCHMPKVEGSATTIRMSEKHAFHGFAGARHKPEMLSQYVALGFEKTANGFNVVVENKAPHNLMTHPLRVVQLRVNLIRDGKTTALQTQTFVKVLGRDNVPSMPWTANAVLEDTMIKSEEKRVLNYSDALLSKDIIEVQLGFYVVNPKALKGLNLDGDKELEKFTILKDKYFTVE